MNMKNILIAVVIFGITHLTNAGCNAPPGSYCYETGRLIRPLLTTAINHHDVLIRYSDSAQVISQKRCGFFADNVPAAVAGAYLWSRNYSPFVGWVDGHTGDEGVKGSESMNSVNLPQYVLVKSRMFAKSYPNGYHLALFNCQTWASQTLN